MRAEVALTVLIWLALQVPIGTLVGRLLRNAATCPECHAPLISTHVCKDPR